MSDHYHVVLFINSAKQVQLTDFEVLERWSGLFRGNLLVNRYVRGDDLCEAELHVVNEMAEQWCELDFPAFPRQFVIPIHTPLQT